MNGPSGPFFICRPWPNKAERKPGVANGTYIFSVPGSPGACKDARDGILKYPLDNRHRPCNFDEIMPRLLER